ncbi:MAG: hypothetical protein U0798_09555 [Gemmataceae bacterium]
MFVLKNYLHLWILGVVAITELIASSYCRYSTLNTFSDRTPPNVTGEGLVIRGDGLGYYAWLRSSMIDRDWDFANEFDQHNIFNDAVEGAQTPTGRRTNTFSIGPAFLWSLGVMPSHFFVMTYGDDSPWPADGYSYPYQWAVMVVSSTMSILGIAFLYRFCVRFSEPVPAALAVAFMHLGTTVFYYNTVELTMGHNAGVFVISLFLLIWQRTVPTSSLRGWFGKGSAWDFAC